MSRANAEWLSFSSRHAINRTDEFDCRESSVSVGVHFAEAYVPLHLFIARSRMDARKFVGAARARETPTAAAAERAPTRTCLDGVFQATAQQSAWHRLSHAVCLVNGAAQPEDLVEVEEARRRGGAVVVVVELTRVEVSGRSMAVANTGLSTGRHCDVSGGGGSSVTVRHSRFREVAWRHVAGRFWIALSMKVGTLNFVCVRLRSFTLL
jgi:hypothetical protein